MQLHRAPAFAPSHFRLLILALLAATSSEIQAQDFFRDLGTSRSSGGIGPVSPSEYTYQDTRPSALRPVTPIDEMEQPDDYNFALGPIRFSLAAGIGVEFNDNITLADDDRESDIVFRPLLNLDLAWPINPTTTLTLSLGASYAKYLEHSEYDTEGILLSPTSAIRLGFEIGAVKFTLRDRFSYQEEPYNIPVLSNVAVYRRFENQAGFDMEWPINERLTFGAGYDHYNLWARDEQFESETRAIDTIFIRPTYQLTPAVKVGLFGSLSYVNFESDDRADATATLVGPLIDIQFSPFLALYLEVGHQTIKFDGASSFDDDFFSDLTDEERALFRDSSDASAFYFKFELSHKATPVFEHALSASRTAEIGFGTDYFDLWHFEYNANFKGLAKTEIGPSLFYEYYETSGDFGEEAHRWGAAIGIRHHLTNSLTVGLDYRFLLKDSNIRNANYYQNIAFLSLYYRF